MRQLSQNKRKLKYANFDEKTPVYVYDSDGNVETTEVDGVDVPVIAGYKEGYTNITDFKANISFDSGATAQSEYGLNTSDYQAIISANKGELPFDEKTLIWHKSKPKYDTLGNLLPESADYKVIAIKTSKNEERFILKKRVDD